MTDKEIIKALECCQNEECVCKECPLHYRRSADCVDYLTRNALNLINRQQAEIERLQSRNKFLEIEFRNQENLFSARKGDTDNGEV